MQIVAIFIPTKTYYVSQAKEYLLDIGFPEEWLHIVKSNFVSQSRNIDHITVNLKALTAKVTDKPLTPKTLEKLPYIVNEMLFVQLETFEQLIARYKILELPVPIPPRENVSKLSMRNSTKGLFE